MCVAAQPALSQRSLRVWNTKTRSTLIDMDFASPILRVVMNFQRWAVCMRARAHVRGCARAPRLITRLSGCRRIAVVLSNKIHLFDLESLRPLVALDTEDNPRGLCVLSPHVKKNYVVFPSSSTTGVSPSPSRGLVNGANVVVAVYVFAFVCVAGGLAVFSASSLTILNSINAHVSPVTALAISQCGSRLATASETVRCSRVLCGVDCPRLLLLFGCCCSGGGGGGGWVDGWWVGGWVVASEVTLLLVRLSVMALCGGDGAVAAAISTACIAAECVTAAPRARDVSQGTIIRVFALPTGDKLYSFRRGTQSAAITCLSFFSDPTPSPEARSAAATAAAAGVAPRSGSATTADVDTERLLSSLRPPSLLVAASVTSTVHVYRMVEPGSASSGGGGGGASAAAAGGAGSGGGRGAGGSAGGAGDAASRPAEAERAPSEGSRRGSSAGGVVRRLRRAGLLCVRRSQLA